jgi:hypothetical protein
MKFDPKNPPRPFTVGFGPPVVMLDCGSLRLDPDEQITFLTESGAEYDVARKSWGFYATPSLNGRLCNFKLHGKLLRNREGKYFLVLVEEGKESLFRKYLAEEGLDIAAHLDTSEYLNQLTAKTV